MKQWQWQGLGATLVGFAVLGVSDSAQAQTRLKSVDRGIQYATTTFTARSGKHGLSYTRFADLTGKQVTRATRFTSNHSFKMTLSNGQHVIYREIEAVDDPNVSGFTDARNLRGHIQHSRPTTKWLHDTRYQSSKLSVTKTARKTGLKVYSSRALNRFKLVKKVTQVRSNEAAKFYWGLGGHGDWANAAYPKTMYRYVYNRRAHVRGWVLATQLTGRIHALTTRTEQLPAGKSNQVTAQRRVRVYQLKQTSHRHYARRYQVKINLLASPVPTDFSRQDRREAPQHILNHFGYLLKNHPEKVVVGHHLTPAKFQTAVATYRRFYRDYRNDLDVNNQVTNRLLGEDMNAVDQYFAACKVSKY